MNKLPLYSIDHDFYLYFDTEDKHFYRALNLSVYGSEKEQKILTAVSFFRKSFPVIIPILLILGAYFSAYFEAWTTFAANVSILAGLSLICQLLFLQYAKFFKKRQAAYYRSLDYLKMTYSLEEVKAIVLKVRRHCWKVFAVRLCFAVITLIFGLLFWFFSHLLILFLYLLMFLLTNYLFLVTSVTSYFVLHKAVKS
ncbi:hypothetical protein DDV21_010915 [Streptococcus chenjunshii]|uniref:Uncharacterized protein n=1 Tax=Streptococcus chenjunshii TaxID=2173853 RepID=A0A372KJ34_9STRE|nr:hypothetical protein [Streptococcus chenjunshii]AXQ79535.1 hypothetical protein DDV21_010915 [Streptococcus chenjunshii]RFU50111.1 hypothetical protein DDV22_10420 [Streptococcus chenjunshii]RFU52263.1 hypothetical protein DDV23_10645 [Streptococcus chenjunshii]